MGMLMRRREAVEDTKPAGAEAVEDTKPARHAKTTKGE